MRKIKWYQEKSFKQAIIALTIMGVTFCIGTSLVDGEFNPHAIYLFGGTIVVTVGLTYLFRDNP